MKVTSTKKFNFERDSIAWFQCIAFITNYNNNNNNNNNNSLFHFHSKAILIITLQINSTIQAYFDFSVDGTFYKSGQQSKGVSFSGQLTYEGSLSHLQGDFRTQSVWRNAFGIEYLTMNNLRLG